MWEDEDGSPCLLESYGRQAEGFGPAYRSVRAGRPRGEESCNALKVLRARFSDFRSPMDSIGVQDSDLSRDCEIGMTA